VRGFLQLFGGVNLSFYDWYCDLPTAFPEIWGEQTDVCESADWYNAKMIADMGACLNMTRTPDCHFFAESRHNGTKSRRVLAQTSVRCVSMPINGCPSMPAAMVLSGWRLHTLY
jgi:nitrate reductase alpha subunit